MKGIFYSAIAIAFITPLLLFVFSELNYNESNTDIYTTKILGDKLASFSKSIENDLPRAMNIISKRALTQSIIYIETSGKPLEDAKQNITNIILNGTTNGTQSNSDFTLSNWIKNLIEKGKQFGFNTTVYPEEIIIHQPDPYTVNIDIKISVNASIQEKGMELYRIYGSKTKIQINGFNDPLYTINTNGIIKRSIEIPPFNVSGVSAFDSFTTGGYYSKSLDGPCFLDRMEGRSFSSGKYNISEEPIGIESVVFLPDIDGIGMSIKENQSLIDYLYFDNQNHYGEKVNGSIYLWLLIDSQHKSIYNLT